MIFIYAPLWEPGMPEVFQKFVISKIYGVFKEVSIVHQSCSYLIKATEEKIGILWNIIAIWYNGFRF